MNNSIFDIHEFNTLPTPEQIKRLRLALLQRCSVHEVTLRDQFAMAVLQGVIAHHDEGFNDSKSNAASNANFCYMVADAMMEARKETP